MRVLAERLDRSQVHKPRFRNDETVAHLAGDAGLFCGVQRFARGNQLFRILQAFQRRVQNELERRFAGLVVKFRKKFWRVADKKLEPGRDVWV